MAQQTQAVATVQKQPVTILGCIQSETWKAEVAKVLPKYLSAEAMLRVARSVAQDPKFAACTPTSFLLALIKCANAGLPPDGRLAHLIPFGKEVQAIFDWKGLVSLASRNGIQVTAKLVFSMDEFTVEEDDGTGHTRVHHKMDITQPRGEIVAVYSRALTSEGVDYEFMTAEEVEQTRQNYSRAKDSAAWVKSWGEMAKKTVIKRHSKRWDLPPEVREAINADDDSAEFNKPTAFARPLFEKKPQPEQIENGKPEPPADAPQPDPPDSETSFDSAQVDPPPASAEKPKPEFNAVKAVRGLCRQDKIREHVLLGMLAELGSCDAGLQSLEELHIKAPQVLAMVVDQWADLSARIKSVTQQTKG